MPEETYRILVADDDPPILELLGEYLATRGHQVKLVPNGELALDALNNDHFDVLVTDLKMPGTDGLALLRHVREQSLPVATIMMTGYGTIESAISAMKSGAHNYLLKPFRLREVHNSVNQAVQEHRREQSSLRLQHLGEFQEAIHNVRHIGDLDGLYSQTAQMISQELEAKGCLFAFYEPVENRWVEYHRSGDPAAFKGVDIDSVAQMAQQNTQPLRDSQCWFGEGEHLLVSTIRAPLSNGPAQNIGFMAVAGMQSTLPNPDRILHVYAGLLGQCIANQLLLAKAESTAADINRADTRWAQALEEPLLECAKKLDIEPEKAKAAAWAIRLRANEDHSLRDLVEGGNFDVVTIGGGGLPMSVLSILNPILECLDEREDGFGSPHGLAKTERQPAARLAAALSHWTWLTTTRTYAGLLSIADASEVMQRDALRRFGEDEVNVILDLLGEEV